MSRRKKSKNKSQFKFSKPWYESWGTPLEKLETTPEDPQPGQMWPCPNVGELHVYEDRMPCWVICVPGGFTWHTNEESISNGLWRVRGEPPDVSIHPSLDLGPGAWHGWIEHGYLFPSKANCKSKLVEPHITFYCRLDEGHPPPHECGTILAGRVKWLDPLPEEIGQHELN